MPPTTRRAKLNRQPPVHHKRWCHQKREGARSNNTLTYYMGLSNVVIYELLGLNTTTDPFPHTSSLSVPVCILYAFFAQ